jgi:hypothetical protein
MLLAIFATTGVRVEYSADEGQPSDWFLMKVLSATAAWMNVGMFCVSRMERRLRPFNSPAPALVSDRWRVQSKNISKCMTLLSALPNAMSTRPTIYSESPSL